MDESNSPKYFVQSESNPTGEQLLLNIAKLIIKEGDREGPGLSDRHLQINNYIHH